MKVIALALICLLSLCVPATADEVRVAVASNFAPTLKVLALAFEKQTEHRLVLSVGSSGKHYAQISHGAPFDLFFSADVKRPQLLEEKGLAITKSRFTYAYGKLVLWQPLSVLVAKNTAINPLEKNAPLLTLKQGGFRYLAIANPKLAPYGKAAEQTLVKLGLWDKYHNKIVRGENIAQAFHFIKSGNAQLGFVAFSQIKNAVSGPGTLYWEVPTTMYQPIEQQAVMLTDNPVSVAFIHFLHTPTAQQIIHQAGYLTATENRP